MAIPIDDRLRETVNRVLLLVQAEGLIDKEAAADLFVRLDEALRKVQAGDAVRKAASNARDRLLEGCRSNGGWLGADMMDAYNILKGALGGGGPPDPIYCFHQNAEANADQPRFADCPDCNRSLMTADLAALRALWLEHERKGAV